MSFPRFHESSSTSQACDSNRHPKAQHGSTRRNPVRSSQTRQNDLIPEPAALAIRSQPEQEGTSARIKPSRRSHGPPMCGPGDPVLQTTQGGKPLTQQRSAPPLRKGPLKETKHPRAVAKPLSTPPPTKRRIIGMELQPPISPGQHSHRQRGPQCPPPRKSRQSPTEPLNRPIVPFRARVSTMMMHESSRMHRHSAAIQRMIPIWKTLRSLATHIGFAWAMPTWHERSVPASS